MVALIDDVWAAIFTDYIKPHDYHSKLLLATVCRTTHRIFMEITAKYVNVYGREVYCGDSCMNAEMYAGRTRHGIMRSTESTSKFNRTGQYVMPCHFVQIRFLGKLLAQAIFNYNCNARMSVVFHIYLRPQIGVMIHINTPARKNNQIDFVKNGTKTIVAVYDYEEISLILQNHCCKAVPLWNIFLGLQDTTRFIETMGVVFFGRKKYNN